MAFGLDGDGMSKAHMHQLLIEFLIDQYAQNRHTVLIVDEAQNMTADTLEELRMLSNINSDKDQVLQVILAGQPSLRETLRRPELMQFAQRIAVDYYLESLNRDETSEYIQHRLEVAGGNINTFTEAACSAVYRYSGGTPRLINLLCDTALVYGFAEQTHIIDAPLVEDVVREQHRNSIVPTFNKPLNLDDAENSDNQRHKDKSSKHESQVKKAVTETHKIISAELNQLAEQQPVANLHQQDAAIDYEARSQVVGSSHQSTNNLPESLSDSSPQVSKHKRSTHSFDEHSSASNVTRITKTTDHLTNDTNQDVTLNPERDPGKSAIADSTQASSAQQEKYPPSDQITSKEQSSTQYTNQAVNQGDDEPYFDIHALVTENSQEDTGRESAYKDLYPIVRVTEPKKNVNFLILGFAGGMALTSILMFIAVWMLFKNEKSEVTVTPAVPAAIVSQTQSPAPTVISSEERAQLESIQRERDEAMAAAEQLKRERDAALISAQNQEALRAAEKRANQIISAQERKYANEIERVRQRAFEAEVGAAKASERERAANEEAERARLETIRSNLSSATIITTPVIQAAPVTPPHPVATTPSAEKTASTKTSAQDDTTQFSANPCNSPSAKFLSTCKR